MEWLDSHSGSVQAVATLVLVVLTAYYAWASRALVRETRVTLQAASRSTLQSRLDRISEIFIHNPGLFAHLNDELASGDEEDARFHITGMFLGVLEEAFMQFTFERSMTPDDWGAWQATADTFLTRKYVLGYWQRTQTTFEPSFRQFLNSRIATTQGATSPSVRAD